MPRYHFNVYDGVATLDRDGTQLDGPLHARREGMRLASELMRSEASCPKIGEEWRIEVTDGRGMIMFRIDVMLTDSPATHSDNPWVDGLSR